MLTDLRLQNFRSYQDASFDFSPGVNIIVGPNASGKTNLLEAILVMSRGGSYRARDNELVRFNQSWSRIDSDLDDGGKRTVKILLDPKQEKTFEINTKTYKRISTKLSLPVVVFEPNNMMILTGNPEGRRDYLDNLLEQTIEGYGKLSRQYRRIVAQRNALLKQQTNNKKQIFVWSIRMVETAGQIIRRRLELIEKLNKEIDNVYNIISGSKNKTRLEYDIPWTIENYESQLIHTLETSLENDIARGFTGSGPHRDDLKVMFNKHLINKVASRGEIRTMTLVLKILELKTLEINRGQSPILLLDDVYSELDSRRRHTLSDYVVRYQTFITTTDADLAQKQFVEAYNTIALSSI